MGAGTCISAIPFLEFPMNTYFSNFFGFGGDEPSSARKARQRKHRRTLRIEELESREMLDAGLMSTLADIFATHSPQLPETVEVAPNTTENSEIIPVSPPHEDFLQWNNTADTGFFPTLAAAPVMNISPILVGSTLTIEGTDGNDWVEIRDTGSQIFVHWFTTTNNGATKGTQKGVSAGFTKSQISLIVFNGYEGNDTFKNSYEGEIGRAHV
jgi:hypothetical protein